jgi:hypothetical protein
MAVEEQRALAVLEMAQLVAPGPHEHLRRDVPGSGKRR